MPPENNHNQPSPIKQSEMLCFVGGEIAIKISGHGDANGNGLLTFADDDLHWARDADEQMTWRRLDLDRSELIAIRDFLNRVIPPDGA